MPETMRAMVLEEPGHELVLRELALPEPGPGELVVRVEACGVCRTDLHVRDGELPRAKRPLVPGHQIVGRVTALGEGVREHSLGDRVGIPWLGGACGACRFCASGRENLCDEARFTGYQLDGGYAEYARARARFAFPLPGSGEAAELAPLLCAGLIGYRALRMCGSAARLGLYGFGSAAHLVAQLARADGARVFAVTRPGDRATWDFARSLGAEWAGGTDEPLPEPLDAAILFAPAGELVPLALRAVDKGGVVVCAGIHMSEVPAFPYELLWGERVLRSVANLTRADGVELLERVARTPLRVEAHRYPLEAANRALAELRAGRFRGSAVLTL